MADETYTKIDDNTMQISTSVVTTVKLSDLQAQLSIKQGERDQINNEIAALQAQIDQAISLGLTGS